MPVEVLMRGRPRSFAWIKDLSASGALLRGAVSLTPGERLRLVLRPGGGTAVEVAASVVESRVGEQPGSYLARVLLVASAHDDETLGRIVSGESPLVRPQDHAVLIVMDETEVRHELETAVSSLGRCPVGVITPLDAIVWLQDGSATIDAVVASGRYLELVEFFAFLAEAFPDARRVIAVEREPQGHAADERPPSLAEAILHLPGPPAALASALAVGRALVAAEPG